MWQWSVGPYIGGALAGAFNLLHKRHFEEPAKDEKTQ